MAARLAWMFGGGAFGALLSVAIENTPIGVVVGAFVGGVAGAIAYQLQRRRG